MSTTVSVEKLETCVERSFYTAGILVWKGKREKVTSRATPPNLGWEG